MDMLSEVSRNINKTDIMYPMPKIMIGVDEVMGGWSFRKSEEGKTTWTRQVKGGDL